MLNEGYLKYKKPNLNHVSSISIIKINCLWNEQKMEECKREAFIPYRVDSK